ncbi:BTAD domain-containing putative transcriptional regulator [Actinocrispum wychmicini]|uniref:BTAD domain-containing putative transcriptional regulator n=1 Tax=Actinocrispum wychmicini TaxID=1213861 RepID=UPI001404C7F9|nr:BTAD domain-containing putative transcriptional regulator [Actinocrispum wychmicini]
MPAVDFRLLGPLAVLRAGKPVHVPAGSQQVVLACLLLRANQVVPVNELVEWLWEDEPPSDAWESAKAYVRRLRRTLEEPGLIEAMPDGFRLTVPDDAVDLARFRRLLQEAETLRGAERLARLDKALALWGDEPLASLPPGTAKSRAADALVEEYCQAVENRADAYLGLGRHTELVTDLRAMTARYPEREHFWSQLMVALYRSGKRVEALAAYRRARAYLADEFGITPGAELERTHHGVLTGTLDDVGDGNADAATVPLVHITPAQLPADISDFVGRAGELAAARTTLTTPSGAGAPVLVVSGMPGVGKSAFAVKLAHEIRTRFPDGQLFIDLHGYSEHTPLSPARVLSRILPALGLPSTQVPTDLEDLTNTYRSLVADRRILLVLDNAANAQQVHDLIPAAPESAVLITSRSRMPSLAALTGAHLLPLAPLSPRDSERLVRTILAAAPRPADTDIGQIIELCGYLPLAMRVAATAYLHSARPLPEFITELEQHDRLTALTIADDPRATVRAVFDLSYRTLSARAARLFRLLSLVPGPDFCRSCAHHVAGITPVQADLLLGELSAASLILPSRTRHYRFHDLVRLYAHDRCVTEDDPDELDAALSRLHSYYVTTADQAADALYPTWIRLPRTHPTIVTSELFPVVPNAAQWMGDEALNLIATIRYTAHYGPVEIAWYLSESLRPYVVTYTEHRIEALGAFEVALRAATSAGNRRAVAAMHSAFSSVYIRVRDIQRALPHLRAELGQYLELGFAQGETRARIALGDALATQGYLQDAADQIAEALRIAEQHDFTALQLWALLNFSVVEEWRDQLDVAKKYVLSAFDLIDATSSSSTKGAVHAMLGMIMIRRGEFKAAIEQLLIALDCYRQSGDQHYESEALRGLGQAYSKVGNPQASIAHASKALAVAEELGDEYDITDSLVSLAGTYHELDLTAQARSHVDSALRMCEKLDYRKAHIEALLQLASIDKADGLLDRAEAHTHRAIELAHQGELLRLRGDAEILLAWITLEKGNNDQALRHADNAFTIHQKVNSPYGQTRAAHVKGLALLALGQREQAKREWTTSLEYFAGPAPEIDAIRKAVADIS